MIPKIFHRIWFGDKRKQPTDSDLYWEKIQADHPGWEFQEWGQENAPPNGPLSCLAKVVSEYSRGEEAYAAWSDICRLHLLWEFGGVYCDHDFFTTKPIDPLVESDMLVVSEECHGTRVGNFFMAAPARHPAVAQAMIHVRERIVMATRHGQTLRPIEHTGPEVIQSVEYRPDVFTLPSRILSPYDGFYEFPDGLWWKDFDWPAETFGVHTYASTWGKRERKKLPNGELAKGVAAAPLEPVLLGRDQEWVEAKDRGG